MLALVALLYAVGYFALMNRHLPASPFRAANGYFESSFRWDARQRAGKSTGPETQFPEVTIWDVMNKPLDMVYFRVFPRRDAKVERLRELGYYR